MVALSVNREGTFFNATTVASFGGLINAKIRVQIIQKDTKVGA